METQEALQTLKALSADELKTLIVKEFETLTADELQIEIAEIQEFMEFHPNSIERIMYALEQVTEFQTGKLAVLGFN